MYDRKRPGRPTDPRNKYLELLDVMAYHLCARHGPRGGRSIKSVAQHVFEKYEDSPSVRQLERLYARHGPELERELMERRHGDGWAALVTRVRALILADDRIATIAADLVPGIPVRRWTPAELEELLARAALVMVADATQDS